MLRSIVRRGSTATFALAIAALAGCSSDAGTQPGHTITSVVMDPSPGWAGSSLSVHSPTFTASDTGMMLHLGDAMVPPTRVNDTTLSARIPTTSMGGTVTASLDIDGQSFPLGTLTIYGYTGSHTFPEGIVDDAYAWPRDGRAMIMGGAFQKGLAFFDLDANTETDFSAVPAENMHGPGPTYQDSVFVVQAASDSFETWRVLPTPTLVATYPGIGAAWGAAQLGPTQWLQAGKNSIGTPAACVGVDQPEGFYMSPRHDRAVVTVLALGGSGGVACYTPTQPDGTPVFDAPTGAVAYTLPQIQHPEGVDFSADGNLLLLVGSPGAYRGPGRALLLQSATGDVLADTAFDREAFAAALDPIRPLAYVAVNSTGHPTVLVLDRDTFTLLGEMQVPGDIARASDCCFSAVFAENNTDGLYLYWGQLGTAWHFTLPAAGALRRP
ncbi:MAG: YncE family protein [Gemmatimonadales bacterium]